MKRKQMRTKIHLSSIKQAVQAVLWNEEAGIWYDYDLINQKPRAYFTPSNLSPLIFGCYNKDDKSTLARKILAYIETAGIDAFPGGVPASLMQTGEQWDCNLQI